jgi:hypothetical protein
MLKLDTFARAYIECALWSSTDNSTPQGGEPLDKNYDVSDFSVETLNQMIADCTDFQEKYSDMIMGDLERAGHDFWLTRNGHGAGFWDGDWDEPNATTLTDVAHSYGECNLYVGDDGKLYMM